MKMPPASPTFRHGLWRNARAIYWYRNTPIPELKHRTAEHLVSTCNTDAVDAYLLSIQSGSTNDPHVDRPGCTVQPRVQVGDEHACHMRDTGAPSCTG